MFVAAINILTLISFTVHAVVGCCVHHQHHPHTLACHASQCESSSEDSGSHDSCCEVMEDAAESCAHGCCHGDWGSKNPGSDAEVFVGGEHDSPCDGKHDCEEPTCSFLVAASHTHAGLKAISCWVVFNGNESTASEFHAIARSCKKAWPGLSSPPLSSQCACALLQSWQI